MFAHFYYRGVYSVVNKWCTFWKWVYKGTHNEYRYIRLSKAFSTHGASTESKSLFYILFGKKEKGRFISQVGWQNVRLLWNSECRNCNATGGIGLPHQQVEVTIYALLHQAVAAWGSVRRLLCLINLFLRGISFTLFRFNRAIQCFWINA